MRTHSPILEYPTTIDQGVANSLGGEHKQEMEWGAEGGAHHR